jgi:hypothetical protein
VPRRVLKKLGPVHAVLSAIELPPAARWACFADILGVPKKDPGLVRAIDETVAWLGRAQDRSASADSGVARHYSLITGWGTSYPETTGYIVPTMLAYADWRGGDVARARARRMLDWLVSIQFPEGGFQGGRIDSRPRVPVTFNTGQILLGLASGVRAFGEDYLEPMRRAADWLVNTQDADGCWRKHATPFTKPGEKAYETHVAWGLLEAARIDPEAPYAKAALANVRWALRSQRPNGWMDNCCLTDPSRPLTHTLGYALRGVLEAYRFSGDEEFLIAARRTADGLLSALRGNGFLPGRLHPDWCGAVPWVCLTGTVQIAHCWLLLHEVTGEARYREAAFAANNYVRRTLRCNGPLETRGGVKGSFPVYGRYGAYEYLSWAGKFLIDSNMLEAKLRGV